MTLAGFRSGKFNVLVATDVAARGLDINGIELVIQLEPPKDPEVRKTRREPAWWWMCLLGQGPGW